jgi:HAD superfamily hydrolase (TIGR01509 family)
MLSAALFDLDGTLLDSNRAHVHAWHEALQAHGYNVALDRIAVEIGKGGDQLVPDLLGRTAERDDGDALRDAHDEAFKRILERDGLSPTAGALDLLDALRARHLRIALATSTKAEMLEACERASGIAWRKLFDVVVGADDVKRSKPAPDIVATAVRTLGVSAAECVMVGDSPWDARAAKQAGVVLVGVRCGGNDARTLRRAGSRVVCADPSEIAARLTEVIERTSPGAALLDARALDALMQHALDAARDGMAAGEVPIGSVIARGDGEVLARGWNRLNESRDRSAHGEIDALRNAAGLIAPAARDTILVSTLEPCVMCLGAAMEIAIDTVVYGLNAPSDNGTTRVEPPESPDNQMPRVVGEVRARESRALFEEWLERDDRNRDQEPYVRTLLEDRAALRSPTDDTR